MSTSSAGRLTIGEVVQQLKLIKPGLETKHQLLNIDICSVGGSSKQSSSSRRGSSRGSHRGSKKLLTIEDYSVASSSR